MSNFSFWLSSLCCMFFPLSFSLLFLNKIIFTFPLCCDRAKVYYFEIFSVRSCALYPSICAKFSWEFFFDSVYPGIFPMQMYPQHKVSHFISLQCCMLRFVCTFSDENSAAGWRWRLRTQWELFVSQCNRPSFAMRAKPMYLGKNMPAVVPSFAPCIFSWICISSRSSTIFTYMNSLLVYRLCCVYSSLFI